VRSARTQVWPHAYRVLNAVDGIDDVDRRVEPRPPKTAVGLIGNVGALRLGLGPFVVCWVGNVL